jgi:hypothetical protein
MPIYRLTVLQACLKAIDFAAKTFTKGEKFRIRMTSSVSAQDVVARDRLYDMPCTTKG